jgi:catechol 2,3-dioxygenase-like lactoylglutathione lyase family enzyme
MIDHLSSYTTDYRAARVFYEAIFDVLRFGIQVEIKAEWDEAFPGRQMCAWGPPGKSVFWVIEVKSPYTPRHIAFTAPDRAAVDRFHRAGRAIGAPDGGAPGLRPMYHPNYYGAFLLDPDGNNVEAVCHEPA